MNNQEKEELKRWFIVLACFLLIAITACTSAPIREDDSSDEGISIKVAYIQGWEDRGPGSCEEELSELAKYKEALEMMRDDRDRWLNEIYEINGQNYAEGAGEVDYQIELLLGEEEFCEGCSGD